MQADIIFRAVCNIVENRYPKVRRMYQWKRINMTLVDVPEADYFGRAFVSCSNIEINLCKHQDYGEIVDSICHEIAHILTPLIYKNHTHGFDADHPFSWILTHRFLVSEYQKTYGEYLK